MKLRVLFGYRNRALACAPGTMIQVDDERAAFLLKDAPGCFEVVEDVPPPAELANPAGLTVEEAIEYGHALSPTDLARFLDLERSGKKRATLLRAFEQRGDAEK